MLQQKKTVRWLNPMTRHNFHWIKIDAFVIQQILGNDFLRNGDDDNEIALHCLSGGELLWWNHAKHCWLDCHSKICASWLNKSQARERIGIEHETPEQFSHAAEKTDCRWNGIHVRWITNKSAFTAFTGNFSIQTAFWLFRNLALWCVSVTCAILWNKRWPKCDCTENGNVRRTLEQQSMHTSEPYSILNDRQMHFMISFCHSCRKFSQSTFTVLNI